MDEPRSYLIRRPAEAPRPACDDPVWSAAERLEIDVYPWYESGARQGTRAAMLYDDRALYVLFVCEDAHIHAVETAPNGNVYLDSCVELFAMPDGAEGGYFNLEANCCGTVHLGFGAGRHGRTLAPPDVLADIAVATSIPTPTREETPADDGWWLTAEMPFAAISRLAGRPVAPTSGSIWRANLYRCGGKTDVQYACWNPIGHDTPDYHRPEYFGTLTFE